VYHQQTKNLMQVSVTDPRCRSCNEHRSHNPYRSGALDSCTTSNVRSIQRPPLPSTRPWRRVSGQPCASARHTPSTAPG
jgi:hypothetical protein